MYLFEYRYAWGQFVLKMFWAPFWGLKEGRKYFLLFSSLPFSYISQNPLKKIPPRLNWKETASTRVSIIHHASFTDSQVHFQNHTLTPSYSVSHFTPRQKESLVQFPTSPGAHHLHWQISAWLVFRVIHLPRQLCGAGAEEHRLQPPRRQRWKEPAQPPATALIPMSDLTNKHKKSWNNYRAGAQAKPTTLGNNPYPSFLFSPAYMHTDSFLFISKAEN